MTTPANGTPSEVLHNMAHEWVSSAKISELVASGALENYAVMSDTIPMMNTVPTTAATTAATDYVMTGDETVPKTVPVSPRKKKIRR